MKMLARRELSEAQIRQRLSRKEFSPEEIDDAVATLRESRAIDDERVAAAIARTETGIKRRGKLRVRRQIEQAGIGKTIAARAVEDVFGDIDPDALVEAALAKRLRGGRPIADDREFQRLYRYLSAQGFEHDRIMSALDRRRAR